MFEMLFVSGFLALFIWGMIYFDSRNKKSREMYRPGITKTETAKDSANTMAGLRHDMKFLRECFGEELKGLERRLCLKLAIIIEAAICVFVLFLKCCK
jgi:hypothetical protein